jgi:cbb3-type cytochrome oxidase subunit 3
MFKRVQFEEWQALITIVAFILCFLTFVYFAWRAVRMSKDQRRHMSNLPLESEDKKPSSDEQSR